VAECDLEVRENVKLINERQIKALRFKDLPNKT
jgi:hypothetical protein